MPYSRDTELPRVPEPPRIAIATPKGRLATDFARLLTLAGVDASELLKDDRALIRESLSVKFAMLRNEDVPTYVERGAASIGVVGKDVLRESGPRDVIEYADLGFGACEMILAFPEGASYRPGSFLRVATKYPNLAREVMEGSGYRFEIITLKGSCEIAPAAGLADAIVDLSATGETLRANRLSIVKTTERFTARLILNPAAYRMDGRVRELADRIVTASNPTGGGYI